MTADNGKVSIAVTTYSETSYGKQEEGIEDLTESRTLYHCSTLYRFILVNQKLLLNTNTT